MADTAAILPFEQAALARDLSVPALRRLSRKHGGSFLAKRGARGRGKSALVDMAALDALLAPQSGCNAATEADRRKGAVLDRLPDTLADRFAAIFHGGELTALCPNLKPRDAARITVYVWAAAVEATRTELAKAGIEPPPLEVPEKLTAIRRF